MVVMGGESAPERHPRAVVGGSIAVPVTGATAPAIHQV